MAIARHKTAGRPTGRGAGLVGDERVVKPAEASSTYPAISDHGLIGDLQTAALVSTQGEIDWFCCPRFDSPSVFASLLSRSNGGSFKISPTTEDHITHQSYFPDTAVLVTRFMSEAGVGSVIDLMPIIDHPRSPSERHRIVRIIRAVRGQMSFVIQCNPAFDYGRGKHKVKLTDAGAVFESELGDLTLHVVGKPGHKVLEDVDTFTGQEGGVRLTVTLREGEISGVVLESAAEGGPRRIPQDELTELLNGTVNYWRTWLARSNYTGRWREMVNRSAMAIKLMTYAPSGALVAAPTAGLPEQIGGERNWDYRFTWIRDASFSVHALSSLGFIEEEEAFGYWLRDRLHEHIESGGGQLPIMYRIDGSSDLEEFTLDHFEGYRGSKPVRIGNAAGEQLQLDIYGEAMLAVYQMDEKGFVMTDQTMRDVISLMNWLCDHWDQPDEGIWETRGGRQPFVYGRLMCWVAFDRMIRIVQRHGRPAPVARWTAERDKIYEQIMASGWNPKMRAFTQYNGSSVLDAALLRMPMVDFISARDPKWVSTLEAMERVIVSDSLVYRYDPAASPDGLRGSEGTFSMCTFWYVDALAVSRRVDEARLAFEKMFTYANPIGLYGEEIGLTGEQLGNFPQAFSHLGLINSAVFLNECIERTPKPGLGGFRTH
ncbi:glycoside hydrolase family 15 protein [Pedosphaera parvula]|uniref:Glycoside hydrolase 15-related n=1 Tax=Pedosphaera parvula (strain Ellin514) TaxID=320771 RepID=B9XEA7_PEDPL|nr:glycoside hydrolase family 15 protein [Pedosphaera parvula]EEF61998.1 glycoside hydrolase 15-related [Pedosphaera parvula Ellin514]